MTWWKDEKRYREIRGLLVDIRDNQGLIIERLDSMTVTLDQVLADVTDESTKLDSLGAFIAGLKQQIADALSGTTLPAPVQAKIDAVFAGVEANKAKVQTALDANIPPAPVA